jgi:hypothetical protein
MLDSRTMLPEADLVPMDVVYPHFEDEAYEVLYSQRHRWFYKSAMGRDEVLVFKLCDTEANVAKGMSFL